jgi:DNA replication protein DnaC
MHTQTVVDQLRAMRLATMAESFVNRIRTGDDTGISAAEFFALVVEDEFNSRENRKLARMIGRANFKPEQATMENIIYEQGRGFSKSDMLALTTTSWLDHTQNIILTGSTGAGKTYLAESIGYRACSMGFPVLKIRYLLLFEEIHAAKGTGLYLKYLKKLSKTKVLIIDDFLMNQIDENDCTTLMDILEEKEQTGSIIITTQYPTEKWHLRIADPTVADAICDRLVHGAITFNLDGDSMGKR